MSEGRWQTIGILLGSALIVGFVLLTRPGYLASASVLETVIAAELVLITVIKYRQAFFPALMITFLFAGTRVPFQEDWLEGRWFVLAVGAVAGLAIYMKDRTHSFGVYHLIALFCVASAVISALVSGYPEESILKAISWALLFIYASSGGRLASSTQEPEVLFGRLVVGCEVLTYVTGVAYFILHWPLFGNPNSLGATMGVAVVPLLAWGFIISTESKQRLRRGFALFMAVLLLLSSLSRAGIAAGAISVLLIYGAARQYRTLLKGAVAVAVLALFVTGLVPSIAGIRIDDESTPVSSIFIHKGKQEEDVLESRHSVWKETWSVIRDRPWFGSGFGTSVTSDDLSKLALAHAHFDSRIIREHGNSYLEIAEWVGLLGLLPFYSLAVISALNVGRAFRSLRRTCDLSRASVPAGAIVAAGLIHAFFEDWMFAVGYYLCVFFWSIAFILVDVLPARDPAIGRAPVAVAKSQLGPAA